MTSEQNQYDIAIIGGAGHVGLPLALAFAVKGKKVLIVDKNEAVMETIKQGQLPHLEFGAQDFLDKALKENKLFFSSSPEPIEYAEVVVLTIGTPVDEFLNPDIRVVKNCVDELLPYLHRGQLLVLRSTVFPGTTDWLEAYIEGKGIDLAFCPERVVQSHAIKEIHSMPQIVSGVTESAIERAKKLFSLLAPDLVCVLPKEAEFAKLFANAYRYIQFAVVNQFYMMAENANLDYYNIYNAVTKNYSRLADMPKPGFAAGPCLFKDTMQLLAFAQNEFSLGNCAMLVNEGLPLHVVQKLKEKYKETLSNMTIGLLGMAFKPETDDIRSSLSYKLKKNLSTIVKEVLTTDPYVTIDPTLKSLDEVLEKSDVLILCTPHKDYKNLDLKGKEIVDVWGSYLRRDPEAGDNILQLPLNKAI